MVDVMFNTGRFIRDELKRELARCLRTGRTRPKSQGRKHRRGKTRDMTAIVDLSAVAANRFVPRHREGPYRCLGHRGEVGTLKRVTIRSPIARAPRPHRRLSRSGDAPGHHEAAPRTLSQCDEGPGS